MFAHPEVEAYVNNRLWQMGVDIGKQLGLNEQSHVLDLGCGDGAMANNVLAKYFGAIDGYDQAPTAIKRARESAPRPDVRFAARDITKMDFSDVLGYDGAYLWGILHHVKNATASILNGLRRVTRRVVVLEPNGDHILRRLLERTTAYRNAGEESFCTKALEQAFCREGFRPVIWKRLNLFPNFTPLWLFRLLKPFERTVENSKVLRAFCTVNMWGFIADE
jgi:ubiquinone/menaquinone biosynthesis C-methylase UbiE